MASAGGSKGTTSRALSAPQTDPLPRFLLLAFWDKLCFDTFGSFPKGCSMKLKATVFMTVWCLAFAIPDGQLQGRQTREDSYHPTTSGPTSSQQNIQQGERLPSETATGGPTHNHLPDTNPGRTAHDTGHGAEIAGIAGGVVAGAVIIDLIHHHEVVNRIKSNGPQVPKAFDMNNLHITGFVQGGWPLGVEYSLPGTVAAREDITAGERKGWFLLPPTGGARRIMLARLPAGFVKKREIADYWLHLDTPTLPVSAAGWPGLRIYAVAAGPNAVGSVAIDQVSFAPTDKPVRESAGDAANFGFHSHSDFDSVLAEFQLVAPYQGHNFISTEQSMNVPPVSEDQRVQGLRWQPRKVRSGDHIVRIVAWRGINRGADWVSAFSADMVSVEQ